MKEYNYICGHDSYVVKADSIVLMVDISNLPETIQVERNILYLKSSFHVSLVCYGKIIEKEHIKIKIEDFGNSLIKDFCEFIKNNPVVIKNYLEEFKFVQDKERKSVIMMCEVSNLDRFFNLINEKYGLSLKLQPTHITLYTLQPNKGIFVIDEEDIEKLTQKIDRPKEFNVILYSDYYRNLPKKRMGAGVLLFNNQNELLILKTTYQDHWTIPGGSVDINESPKKAAIRETREEIGLNLYDVQFLCVDYSANIGNDKGESLQFLFYGGILSDEQIKDIKIPDKEINQYKFLKIQDALPLFSLKSQKRISKCINALKNNTSIYLEDAQ